MSMTMADLLYKIRGDASSVKAAAAETVVAMGAIGASSQAVNANMAALTTGVGSLTAALPALAGAFTAVGLGKWLKQSALTAARTQVLGTVFHQVGTQAGYTRDELVNLQSNMRDYGITTQVARQATARMVQSQLDLKYALDLARGAQDLANVSGWNSSKTLERVIWGIASMRTQTLRMLGLSVSRVEAEKKYRKELNRTSGELTTAEKKHAFMMAVLEALKPLQGSYVQSMKDVGKQLLSMERYIEESANALGEFFLPAMLSVVMESGRLLKQWYHAPKEFRRVVVMVLTAATAFVGLWTAMMIVVKVAPIVKAAIMSVTALNAPLLALSIIISLVAAAWATDFLGLARGTDAFMKTIKYGLGMIGVMIGNLGQIVGNVAKYLWVLLTRPWDTAALEEAHQGIINNWGELVDAAKFGGSAIKDAWVEAAEGGKILAFDVKKVEKELTKAQKEARDEILAYGIRMTILQVIELKKLHDQELKNYVAMLKDEEDELRSRDKSALQDAKDAHRDQMAAMRARHEAEYDLMAAQVEVEASMGRMGAERAEAERQKVRDKRLTAELKTLNQELAFWDNVGKKQAEERHISYGEYHAKRTNILARIQKQEARITQEEVKSELRAFELRLQGAKDYTRHYLNEMKSAHDVAEAEDKDRLMKREIDQVEYVRRQLEREQELLDGQLYAIDEELREHESANATKGTAYADLQSRRRAIMDAIKAAEINGEREITEAIKEEFRDRMDLQMDLAKEMAMVGAKNERIARRVELEIGFAEEAELMRRAKEDLAITQRQYDDWYIAREAKLNEEIDDMYRNQTEINRFYWEERMKHAEGFFEGVRLGLEEMTIEEQNAAQMGYEIMSSFATGTRDVLSTMLFDFSRNEFKTMAQYWLMAVEQVSQTLSKMISRMIMNWLLMKIAGVGAAKETDSALTREAAHVGVLIAMYYQLAAAKAAASMAGGGFGGGGEVAIPHGPGFASGGKIPGYGGGDSRKIRVEPGEYVMRKESVRAYGAGFFDALNKLGKRSSPSAMVRHRAQGGGQVAASELPGASAGHTTIVMVTDKEELSGYFDSSQYGRVVVKRMGPELIRRMGGEE